MQITSVTARQLLDCKCRPLVEVEVHTADGSVGRGAAPTGSSVGMYEAHVLRDGDPDEYRGLSVHRAVAAVTDVIAPAIIGCDVLDQRGIDEVMIELDGTERKTRLGGNAIYSTSIAVLRAAAATQHLHPYQMLGGDTLATVPVPTFNMVNGGRYPDVVQPFNEFLVMPYRADSIYSAVEMSVNLFATVRDVLAEYLGGPPAVAGSYGYAAPSADPAVVLSLLAEAIDRCGYADSFAFALDCASSEMFDAETGTYELLGDRVTSRELVAYTKELTERFDFVFIEDLLDENDWDGFSHAVAELDRTIVLGDDLIVTDRDRLARAAEERAVGGFILKPNQVGTISEALDTHAFAVDHGLISVPSGRSGGVIDDVVMDLSVGLQVPFQKNGAPRSGERIEKLNFLMRAAESIPGCTLHDVPGLVRF
ncbi:phosphopyruvate hydratase [Propionicicella superfundia]|uniref:phosphopyruvate hydratase n=1 Tax=Propionicicella superfundia TaxID=348582 RepID=UPI0004159B50|nr:enolase [Propionicicella superfundia]